jgi:hypothetical protein
MKDGPSEFGLQATRVERKSHVPASAIAVRYRGTDRDPREGREKNRPPEDWLGETHARKPQFLRCELDLNVVRYGAKATASGLP